MKSRYLPVLYVGMAFAALAVFFHCLGRINRFTPRNPTKISPATTALPAEMSEVTLSDIRSTLEKQEYHISPDHKTKRLQSPNRKHNLRAYYEPGKLTVQTRVDTTGHGFKMQLINEGVFADGKLLYTPQTNAKADYHESKVQINHRAFTEEFVNNEDGVRQNFIVQSAPEGTRQLQVKMTAKGLRVEQGSGNELHFYSKTPNGQTRHELVYSDLKCWDADKKPLNATLACVDNRIQISVDVANAAYPVTIDPIIANGTPQNANKVLEINQSNMWLGFSVSSAGDVNGDGYSEVIVGAPQYDKGQDNEGAAFVYMGAASGLTLTAITLEGNQADAKMGYSVASAGDFNNDGYSDVLVGAPYYDLNGIKDAGMAKLYFGSATGISNNINPLTFYSSNKEDFNGIAVATAGDINGDGYSDVMVGAHSFENQQNNEGAVFVYYGSQNGTILKQEQLEYHQPEARFGYSLAPAGDVDADGFSDIIIGARYYTNGVNQASEGAAFIYRGSQGGLLSNPVVVEGNQLNAGMGNKVSSAGDVNGDGYSDVLISAYLYDGYLQDEGVVYLHLGSSNSVTPLPSRGFLGEQINAQMGSSVACAGDVNGDGLSDIILGAQYYDNGQFNEGAVFVYSGSKSAIIGNRISMMESNQVDGWFGTAVASAGDVNGDGYSDVVVGCYTFDNGQKDEGHVFIYHGGAEVVGTKDAVTLSGSEVGAEIGYSVANAGDVNSDGFDDVIVGAPKFDYNGLAGGIAIVYYGSINGIDAANKVILSKNQAGAFFGASVAGAGDVNGDGYGDIIVGATDYDNNQTNEGAAFVYYGSLSGIDQASSKLLDSDIANSSFGQSVAGAGDINRDGYADVVIGDDNYSVGETHEGAIFIYYGSASGPINQSIIESNAAFNHFGGSVSSAGDVNGDGYNDVIVGAAYAGQNGAAYIYHGSAQGLQSNNHKSLFGNQANAYMGMSVSSAGDVNGDGFSDVIVGAPSHDKNEQNEGIATVYYGSLTGSTDVSPAPTILEQNVANAGFGGSVKSAGDVNGDGYSDVIVGANLYTNVQDDEGKISIFHGSPTGIKSTASFSFESDVAGVNLGSAVSGAGDVNGDGYSDIIVGAPHANNGQTNDVGAALVFYGNNSKGLKNNVRLFNSDQVTPINYSQFSQSNFVATLFAKSFLGRNKGKFVWETMGPGTPFSKIGTNPITTSNQSTGSSALGNVSFVGGVFGAVVNKQGIATKLRVRMRYSPVLAITGQMYGPWRYPQSQLAGYNNAPVPENAMAETIRKKAEPEIETSVTLFPNPASDRMSIQVADPTDIQNVRLYNTTGNLIFQSQQYVNDIDVSKLPGGTYILMLNRANGTSTSHRILIRR